MLSKSTVKFIKSLQLKKYRKKEQAFLVEGAKSVLELLKADFQLQMLLTTPAFLDENPWLLQQQNIELIEVSESQLSSVGSFKSNNAALAVVSMPEEHPLFVRKDEYALVLDDVRDPGNLGTILRIADWYGIQKIICSHTCADFYNPKVISASMGSFTRVKVHYTELEEYLQANQLPVYGAFLEGENVHQTSFSPQGLILMGNESQGVHSSLEKFVSQKIHIPRFGGAESLNVAVATAVICDNLRRDE